jgi:hypothetical protein
MRKVHDPSILAKGEALLLQQLITASREGPNGIDPTKSAEASAAVGPSEIEFEWDENYAPLEPFEFPDPIGPLVAAVALADAASGNPHPRRSVRRKAARAHLELLIRGWRPVYVTAMTPLEKLTKVGDAGVFGVGLDLKLSAKNDPEKGDAEYASIASIYAKKGLVFRDEATAIWLSVMNSQGGGLKDRVLVIADYLEDEAAAENAEKRRR